jgi:uncharacterized protein (DUF697 family)
VKLPKAFKPNWFKTLPEEIDPKKNLDLIRIECEEMAQKRAYLSAGAAIVPVPFADVVIDAGMLSQLLPEISERFGLSKDRMESFSIQQREIHWQEMRSRAAEFVGLVATRGVVKRSIQGAASKILTKQVAKFIPLGGQMVAAGLGYTIMKKVAHDHIDECYRLASRIQDRTARLANKQG